MHWWNRDKNASTFASEVIVKIKMAPFVFNVNHRRRIILLRWTWALWKYGATHVLWKLFVTTLRALICKLFICACLVSCLVLLLLAFYEVRCKQFVLRCFDAVGWATEGLPSACKTSAIILKSNVTWSNSGRTVRLNGKPECDNIF